MTDLIARARAYVDKMPPAVAGQHGHTATFKVAVALVHGFGLSESDAMPIMEEYSSRCSPPWKREELEHKVRSAAQHATVGKPHGYLRAKHHRPAPPEPPPPARQKKKISLRFGAEASQSVATQNPFDPPANQTMSGSRSTNVLKNLWGPQQPATSTPKR
jgi:hypothetical protein